MQRILFLSVFSLGFYAAQSQKVEGAKVDYQSNSGFSISKPLSEMPIDNEPEKEDYDKKEIKIRRQPPAYNGKKAQPHGVDPLVQTTMGLRLKYLTRNLK